MPSPRLGFVALGLASLTEERLAGVVRVVGGAARTVGAPIAAVTAPLIPRSLREFAEGAVTELDTRGRSVVAAGTDRGNEFAEVAADRISRDPAVLRVVENMVDTIQWRVVDAVLPGVLERLADEPEQIRLIVQGQSIGMVEEVTKAARARAAGGDDAVDRFVSNLLHRDRARDRRIRKQQPVSPDGVEQVAPAEP